MGIPMKTLALDFDGVIHRYSRGYQDGSIYDEPIEGTKEALEKLSRQYRLVIFTARDITPIIQWLAKYGLEEFIDEITNQKPHAIAYIDDRGVRFTNWKDITNYFYSNS
jgi:phosphoglycolate phosphatase-like HAD superfamily hydrolase